MLLAIGAYRIALIYRTLEVAPSAYAATQNNLGTAYWHLANQPSTHYEELRAICIRRSLPTKNRWLRLIIS
ncbi:MAG: hypothetical protein HC936_07945 [Leptolyngbyaceae cyanobacterium SU_3_3]|nr:hypothetical protein [Leptolyngbyaceae cyanobacterium SU_3_3]